ncbi:MAG: HAMP domain-containing sensor histidine kinase [Planctomycetota bacterium]
MDAFSAQRRLLLERHRLPPRRRGVARAHAPPPSVGEAFSEALERAKLDSLKELAYGASHEINNPLANIALRAQTLLKREDDPDKRRALEAMHRGAMRAHEMISDLMLFARPPRLERSRVDVGATVAGVCSDLQPVAAERSIDVRFASEENPCCAEVDAVQITVAVKALLENAIEAIGSGGQVRVGCRSADEGVEVVVDDDGPGIPAEVRAHIFDPFFSGREAGRGLGFGLSKCWRITTDHGGSVRVENSPLGGARFVLSLPVAG